jgi:membrane protein DedA with SNARE-associated domain
MLSLSITETLSNFIVSAIEQLGYVGVFIAMGLESACIPLPSEIIMPFSGYVAWKGGLTLMGVTLAGTLGCLVGSLVLYYVGLFGGRPLLARYGKYVFIREKELNRADAWFVRYGDRAVFFSRMLPGVRSFLSLPAGIVRMDVKKFSLYTTAGSLPWCFGLAYIGFLFGPHWAELERLFVYLDVAVIVGIMAFIGYVIYHREWIVKGVRG